MHIENVHIHVGGAIAQAMLAALVTEQEDESGSAATAATFDATADAERLRNIARGMSYNETSQAATKHTLNEVAMRLATGGYSTAIAAVAPQIGEPWPGIDGSIYAGVSRGENGEPDGHLVLLNAKPDRDLTWEQAVEWEKSLGDGARLPTRFESALLYANVQDQLDTERWHWTGTQYSSDGAWGQYFINGHQHTSLKKFEARARAVRRF